MNTIARTTRVGARSTPYMRFPTSSIARKSTLTQVFSDKAIHPIGPYYSQAIKANGFVFLSAQLPADQNCKLVGGSVSNQTHKMIQNASHVLQAAGSDLEKVVKVNLSVRDFHMVEDINEVYVQYFPQRPARTVAQVAFMPAGADMMMDMVAVVDGE
ncbi:YjgF-like protein [Aureobasidium sp. EXF-10727]|nr:YjgF-like protein [Aureobasidium sp. EXF-10727]